MNGNISIGRNVVYMVELIFMNNWDTLFDPSEDLFIKALLKNCSATFVPNCSCPFSDFFSFESKRPEFTSPFLHC